VEAPVGGGHRPGAGVHRMRERLRSPVRHPHAAAPALRGPAALALPRLQRPLPPQAPRAGL